MLSLDAPSNSPQFHVFGGHVTFSRKPIIQKIHKTSPRAGFCETAHSHLVREGNGTSYCYTKSQVFSAFAAPKWNTGDFIVRHYTVATGTRREQQQQNPGDSPCFERYSDARNTVQQRLGRTPPPSMVWNQLHTRE